VAFFDAHTHLDMPAFDPDRDEVLRRARTAGLVGAVVCAADPARWDHTVAIAEAHGLRWTLGLHPWWEAELSDPDVDRILDDLARRDTPHGIGETGLDHARARTPEARHRQERVTAAHLALARERQVPVVLHVVRAYPQVLNLLTSHPLPEAGGMVHSWSGHADMVAPALRRGLYLSFSASVVRSRRQQDALRQVPDDRLLLETDCPDQPFDKGARGEPVDLLRTAEVVAQVRGQTVRSVLAITTRNAERLFGPGPNGPRILDPGSRPAG